MKNKLINLEFIINLDLKIWTFINNFKKIFLKRKNVKDVKKKFIMKKINLIFYIKITVVNYVLINKNYDFIIYILLRIIYIIIIRTFIFLISIFKILKGI